MVEPRRRGVRGELDSEERQLQAELAQLNRAIELAESGAHRLASDAVDRLKQKRAAVVRQITALAERSLQ